MKHDTGLLTKATQLAADAYNETIPGAQKFENPKPSTTAFVLKTAEADYCIWRGTESMRDWRFNAMFWPWPVKRAFVHYGFYRHQQAVWKELRKILNPGKKTIFAGHSLGGACAEISALLFQGNDTHLITLGKPNTMSKIRSVRLDHLQTHYSVVNGSDLVARIPRIGYQPPTSKVLRQLWFSDSGKNFINPETSFKREEWSAAESVSDHSVSEYVERMAGFCKQCTTPPPTPITQSKKKKRKK